MPASLPADHSNAALRARILIVEDEPIVALDLESQLGDMGYEVCGRVDNGRAAIVMAEELAPDLILMDIVLKGDMDGIVAADHINHDLHIPVIFLTAYSDEVTVQRAAHTAPYGFLTKPFQPREVSAGITVALYKAKLEQHLRDSEQWFASTLDCVSEGVVATDADRNICFMNPAAESLLGWTLEEANGKDAISIVRMEDGNSHEPLPCPISRALTENAVVGVEFGNLLVRRNGERLPVDDSAAPISNSQGKLLGAVAVFRDVSERHQAEIRLRASESRFHTAFDFAPVGMALIGIDNRFLQVNKALCQMLGADESQLIGMNQDTFSRSDELHNERALMHELLDETSLSVQFEKRFHAMNGEVVWSLVNASLLRLNGGNAPLCFLLQIHDISQRKEAEFRLTHLAHFDPLTGLANRAWLSEEIEREIVSARRRHQRLAVIFIDLDNFKQVNDSLGHEAGDELLKTIAMRLRGSVRESDVIGRLGGDEFVLLLPEIKDTADIVVVIEKLQNDCAQPMQIAGQEIRVGMSLGVSIFPDDALDSRTLFRYADSALYHAKAEGRNHLQFYRPELTASMEHRLRLSADLRSALEHDELELYFQPIVALIDRKPVGAEALIRWNHPRYGLLEPGVFIPIAEETGLTTQIGEWVIGQACLQAAHWEKTTGKPLAIAVNVSPSQFKGGKLAQDIRHALTESKLCAEKFCIEITEQLLLNDSERNCAMVNEIKALGVKVAIDDFGTGYSSLSYINRFAPDELKIDKSLTDCIGEKSGGSTLVSAAIAMANGLNLEIVTEGIETVEQEAFLKAQGCQWGQGFLYAKPVRAEDFLEWLQHARSTALLESGDVAPSAMH